MKYNNPPIVEAIFDIRIDELTDFSIEKIENLHSQIIFDYPEKKKQFNFVGKFEFKDNLEITNETDSQISGVIFINKSNCKQVQFRKDGFTFNMLKPYSQWADFSKEAIRLWQIYDSNLLPKSITRIALRYLNKIEIPLPFNTFQEYIINMPPIPRCLPQLFKSFFMQTEIPCLEEHTNVIITETFEKPNITLPFILDIDIYKSCQIEKDSQILMKEFEVLREFKNRTFENCITDKARKLFE